MDDGLEAEIAGLWRMRMDELRQRYSEVFGEESRTAHKQHLVRRIAWRLQALAQGDLSERAAAAGYSRLPTMRTSALLSPPILSSRNLDRRCGIRAYPVPAPCSHAFTRIRRLKVKVLAAGFEYNGKRYASLSAVAREATGTRWNGLVFFGLAKRGEKRRAAR